MSFVLPEDRSLIPGTIGVPQSVQHKRRDQPLRLGPTYILKRIPKYVLVFFGVITIWAAMLSLFWFIGYVQDLRIPRDDRGSNTIFLAFIPLLPVMWLSIVGSFLLLIGGLMRAFMRAAAAELRNER